MKHVLGINNFKATLKRDIFKCISWLNSSFLELNIGVF
jgi:hypothetical protein